MVTQMDIHEGFLKASPQDEIAALKESNRMLAFDLEKTRLWAIAAEEELDEAKLQAKAMTSTLEELKNQLLAAKEAAEKALVALQKSEAEKDTLMEIIHG